MAQTFHRYRAGDKPVDRYKLIRKLGEGGFGEVWQASAPGGAEVAIKFIDLTGQQGFREFKSLRLVKKITHNNLTPLYGFWLKTEDGRLIDESDSIWSQAAPTFPLDPSSQPGANVATAVLKEPVELIVAMGLGKESLYDRLRECQKQGLVGIPADELLDYMRDAAKGIDYLNKPRHDLGSGLVPIVHSDIKPHNILIVGDGAQVSDFGLAQAIESLRKTGAAPLTLAYAAPESFRGKPCDKSDQYSLAITYIELRTGCLPFDDSLTGYEVMTAHVQGQLDFSRLTPGEAAVLLRATALLPQDRWETSRQMVEELRKSLRMSSDSGFAPDLGTSGPMKTRTPRAAPMILPDSSETPPARHRGIPMAAKPFGDGGGGDGGGRGGGGGRDDGGGGDGGGGNNIPPFDNVQFTVYRPKVVQPMKWHPLLAFAHLSERPPDAPADELDPIEEVKRQAARVLGDQLSKYGETVQDSMDAVPHEGELLVLPEIDGVEFNPSHHSFRFSETVHKVEFRMRAAADRDGHTLRGRLSVFLGAILLADVPLQIKVDSSHTGGARPEPTPMRRYRNIFASYSHRDLAVVEQFERFAETLGDRYVRDWKDLRAGEKWDDRLRSMIEEADVFQLFWSRNSMLSPFCRREWEHALSLGRDHFIRPTYWEDPFPESSEDGLPPNQLLDLQFTKLLVGMPGPHFPAATTTRQERIVLDALELTELARYGLSTIGMPLQSSESATPRTSARTKRTKSVIRFSLAIAVILVAAFLCFLLW